MMWTRLPRIPRGPLVGLGFLASLALGGCDMITGLIGGGDAATEEAEALLKSGDLPGAAGAYQALDAPDSVDVATGAAFTALLQGDASGADAVLAASEDGAGDRLSEVKMRRALVALAAGDLDLVRSHGETSGHPVGALLAAEVLLADGDREEAAALLNTATSGGGNIGATARAYLDLIADPEPLVAGLSEAHALWALGEKKIAVRSVEELVKALPDDEGRQGEQLLVWSGRAASVGEIDIAQSLLDALIFPPDGQQWRKYAAQAIVDCAAGRTDECLATFKQLEQTAPGDGLADARATAAYLVAGSDPDTAKELAGQYISNAAARALLETGDRSAALESAPDGLLRQYIEAGG